MRYIICEILKAFVKEIFLGIPRALILTCFVLLFGAKSFGEIFSFFYLGGLILLLTGSIYWSFLVMIKGKHFSKQLNISFNDITEGILIYKLDTHKPPKEWTKEWFIEALSCGRTSKPIAENFQRPYTVAKKPKLYFD